MDSSNVNYIKAARIVAGCSKERLPYVLTVLEKGGIVFTDEELRRCWVASKDTRKDAAERRKEEEHREWIETENGTILDLRYAFKNGVSFTKLSALTGIGRVTLYRNMYGESIPSPANAKKIKAALKELKMERPFWEE